VELSDRIQRNVGNCEIKTPKLEQGGRCARVRGALTAVIWEGKQDGCTLTNVHKLTTKDNFHNKPGRAYIAAIVEDYI
jgi:hypothetical protein